MSPVRGTPCELPTPQSGTALGRHEDRRRFDDGFHSNETFHGEHKDQWPHELLELCLGNVQMEEFVLEEL